MKIPEAKIFVFCLKMFHKKSINSKLQKILQKCITLFLIITAFNDNECTYLMRTISFQYQLLMAEAILSLSADNGWSGVLRFKDKRYAHTILQVMGAALALAGSFIKMLDKEQNFNTLHGQFG